LKPGDTFYFNHALAHRHLWIVAAGPTPAEDFAIFNVTTVKDGCDRSCLLDVGDHPAITHASQVTYLRGKTLSAAVTQQYGHLVAWQPALAPAVLKRVQDGALASPYTPQYLQKIVRQHP
jgi:hypothetical protein